ncbi:phosphinothricin acetyltransferase [Inhella inkyongensis]|uniref:Phosphinothricin acetyltransferase n=1 Tax=Inhella inkyongensis TaxID=392593 RepID=A0A840SCR5_9BURK|nr:phosphinothricin acetyltransferase [Inhella inkyongensis]
MIRPSQDGDLDAITTIYADAVLNGTGTFELDAPDATEMQRRRQEVLARGLPYLVAEQQGRILGYAYANWFRPRAAYRFCVEDSVYLAPDARGQGVGGLLLTELIARCTQAGARQMLAVIGDSANAGSIGLHRSLGFAEAGVLRHSGWKFGRWLDVVMMQRELGLGATQDPL